MAKASPAIRSFNAGVFSKLMEGRTDLDRYPASLQDMYNYVAAPQGPAIPRSGTVFVGKAHGEYGILVPFVFSEDQTLQLEFSADRIRLHTENGTVVESAFAGTITALGPTKVDVPGSAWNVGDEITFGGAPNNAKLNGAIARITAKVGTLYTLDNTTPYTGALFVARVYHVPASFTEAELRALRFVQKLDTVYLTFGTRPALKLQRYGTYDWRLSEVKFLDGPYLPVNDTDTVLTPVTDGNAVPPMGSDAEGGIYLSASGNRPVVNIGDEWLGRELRYNLAATSTFWAFDYNSEINWAGDFPQRGWIQVQFSTAKVIDGYSISAPVENQDGTYLSTDYAPSDWQFEGSNDGVNYVILDRKREHVLYDQGKSPFFELTNETPYLFYRLNIQKLVSNGNIEPRVNKLLLRERDGAPFTINASSTTGINRDRGFLSTDVGRLIRLRGTDTGWRSVRIASVVSPTQITVTLEGEPLPNPAPIKEWRLGAWSYTTGFAAVADFFEDRLILGSSIENPDIVVGSVTGKYETFSPTDTYGAVLDDSSFFLRPQVKRLASIRWLAADEKGLLFGTGSQEFILSASDGNALTAKNPKATASTSRGSAAVEPIKVDRQVLYVQRGGRNIREMAYVYEADGYKSPSMSQLASHLGVKRFAQMEYAQEPYGIAWIRREDGSIVGLTYNRDENVVGWHTHDFSGGVVESISVLPSLDGLHDILWLIVKREVDGETVRYIERMKPFWDFDTTLDEAHFVDCGLRYTGDPATMIYGLDHLEGLEVYGLADTRPVGPYTVTDGAVELEFEASNVVLGLGFDAYGVTSRLENGAADGTAQGKVKRIDHLTLLVWASCTGEFGVRDAQNKDQIVWERIEYPGDNSEVEELTLYDGMIGPLTPPPGYEMDGVVAFRRRKEEPLPFNIVALMPQLNTQDR